jgi:hypothetical protein
MEYFWDRHYSAALPLYQKTLNLYDGHPAAKKYLSEAQAKAVSLLLPRRHGSGPPTPAAGW